MDIIQDMTAMDAVAILCDMCLRSCAWIPVS